METTTVQRVKFLAPNYTEIPNVFFAQFLREFSYAETCVYMTVFRLTFGEVRESAPISVDEFERRMNMRYATHQEVLDAIDSLEAMHLIHVTRDPSGTHTYAPIMTPSPSEVQHD